MHRGEEGVPAGLVRRYALLEWWEGHTGGTRHDDPLPYYQLFLITKKTPAAI
jgi:hypothetical protein